MNLLSRTGRMKRWLMEVFFLHFTIDSVLCALFGPLTLVVMFALSFWLHLFNKQAEPFEGVTLMLHVLVLL